MKMINENLVYSPKNGAIVFEGVEIEQYEAPSEFKGFLCSEDEIESIVSTYDFSYDPRAGLVVFYGKSTGLELADKDYNLNDDWPGLIISIDEVES